MARNGSGTFSLLATLAPANTTSNSSTVNSIMDDIATGLTDSINVDGTKAFEANQPMGGFKLTNLASGSAATDSVNAGQVQAGRLNWADGGGTADAITASYTPAVTSVTDGDLFYVRATAANATTTPTFTPNSGTVTARTIVKNGNVALAVGDINADGHELVLRYRSSDTKYELLNPKGTSYTVNGLTEETSVATDDVLGGYDTSGTAERKFSVNNILKAINALTEDTSPDASADFVLTYDTSASGVKKVKPSNLGGSVDVQTFTSSGTWTKPSSGTLTLVQCWGGGGSGGRGNTNAAAGGGGGGGYSEAWFATSSLGATETVTIGAGGASKTTANQNGAVGGSTTFGSWLTAYGGGGGSGQDTDGDNSGGGGGGSTAAGGTAAANIPGSGAEWNLGHGGASVFGSNSNPGGTGRPSLTVGGGGGAATTSATHINGAGGSSFNGGGGGGAGAEDSSPGPGAGGVSITGGNGGAGAYDANNATAGSQPGGGGGGSETGNSGAGGDGKCIVITF